VRRVLAAAAATLALATPASAAPQVTGTWAGTGTLLIAPWNSVPPAPGDVLVSVTGPLRAVGGATATCSAWWWEDPSGYATGIWRAGGLSCTGDVTVSTGCVSLREALVVQLACVGTAGEAAAANLVITPLELLPTYHFTFTGTLTVVAVAP